MMASNALPSATTGDRRKPISAWEAAQNRFLEGLSDNEKQLFETATPENLYSSANSLHGKYIADSRLRAIQQKLQPLVDCVEDYGKALDVFANASSLLLCPLWGSLRVLIHTAQKYGKYLDKLADMLARIGDVLPRFRVYEALFPNHDRLRQALSDAYLDIIRFCTDVKSIFAKASKSSLKRAFSCKILWKSFGSQFDEYLTQFRRHRQNVEKEAGLSHMLEAKEARELELSERALRRQEAEKVKREKLLQCLTPLNYRRQHRKLQNLRHPGTAVWITQMPKFSSWVESPDRPCFWCLGIPGAGKSVIASSVVDSMQLQYSSTGKLCCYYYCDYADLSTLDISTVFGTLCHQLLSHMTGSQAKLMERLNELTEEGKSTPDKQDLLDFLYLCLSRPQWKEIFLVLDGIDELPSEGQSEVLQMLQHVNSGEKFRVKTFICSRRQGSVIVRAVDKLSDDCLHDIRMDDVREDISAFTRAIVEAKVRSSELHLQDPSMQDEIIIALANGAKDMFLWVKFQVEEICEAANDDQIRTLLEDLPESLAETYSRILAKLSRSKRGAENLKIASKAFSWLAHAKRPLSLDELVEATSIDMGDTFLDKAKIPDSRSLLAICGSLIHFDRTDSTITFAHHTVKQYLLEQSLEASVAVRSVETSRMPIEIHDELTIGKLCLTYLSFSDFETQLVKHTTLPSNKQMNDHIWSQLPHGQRVSQAISMFSRPPALKDASDHTLARMWKELQDPSKRIKKAYSLLQYISQNWVIHLDELRETDHMWPKAVDMAFVDRFIIQHRPWLDANNGSTASVDQAFIKWSLNHSLKLPYRLMIASWGVDSFVSRIEESMGHSYEQILELLISNNQYDTLEVLLDACHSLEFILRCLSSYAHSEFQIFEAAKARMLNLLKSEATIFARNISLRKVEDFLWETFEKLISLENYTVAERMLDCLIDCPSRLDNQSVGALIKPYLSTHTGFLTVDAVQTFMREENRNKLPASANASLLDAQDILLDKQLCSSILCAVAKQSNTALATRLVALGADPNSPGYGFHGGNTAIHFAVINDDVEMLWAFLRRQKENRLMLHQNDEGETALHVFFRRNKPTYANEPRRSSILALLLQFIHREVLLLSDKKHENIISTALLPGNNIMLARQLLRWAKDLGKLTNFTPTSKMVQHSVMAGDFGLFGLVCDNLGKNMTWENICSGIEVCAPDQLTIICFLAANAAPKTRHDLECAVLDTLVKAFYILNISNIPSTTDWAQQYPKKWAALLRRMRETHGTFTSPLEALTLLGEVYEAISVGEEFGRFEKGYIYNFVGSKFELELPQRFSGCGLSPYIRWEIYYDEWTVLYSLSGMH